MTRNTREGWKKKKGERKTLEEDEDEMGNIVDLYYEL